MSLEECNMQHEIISRERSTGSSDLVWSDHHFPLSFVSTIHNTGLNYFPEICCSNPENKMDFIQWSSEKLDNHTYVSCS